jgi:hypothetical protein
MVGRESHNTDNESLVKSIAVQTVTERGPILTILPRLDTLKKSEGQFGDVYIPLRGVESCVVETNFQF